MNETFSKLIDMRDNIRTLTKPIIDEANQGLMSLQSPNIETPINTWYQQGDNTLEGLMRYQEQQANEQRRADLPPIQPAKPHRYDVSRGKGQPSEPVGLDVGYPVDRGMGQPLVYEQPKQNIWTMTAKDLYEGVKKAGNVSPYTNPVQWATNKVGFTVLDMIIGIGDSLKSIIDNPVFVEVDYTTGKEQIVPNKEIFNWALGLTNAPIIEGATVGTKLMVGNRINAEKFAKTVIEPLEKVPGAITELFTLSQKTVPYVADNIIHSTLIGKSLAKVTNGIMTVTRKGKNIFRILHEIRNDIVGKQMLVKEADSLVAEGKEIPAHWKKLLPKDYVFPEVKAIPKELNVGSNYTGKAYRAESNLMDKGKNAQEIVDFEATELGNLDIKQQAESLGADLKSLAEKDVVWVASSKDIAERYNISGQIVDEVKLPKGSTVLATDGEGGYLVYKGKLKTQITSTPQPKPIQSAEGVKITKGVEGGGKLPPKTPVKIQSPTGKGWGKPPVEPPVKTPTPSRGGFDPDKYVATQVAKREGARVGEKQGLFTRVGSFLKDIKRKIVEFAAPIEDVLFEAQKRGGYEILPKYHITPQLNKTMRAGAVAKQFADDNGLTQIIRKVDNIDNLDQYMIAKHGQTLEANGIKTGRDIAKDASLIEAFRDRYDGISQMVTDYSRKLLDYSVDSGLVNKEVADILKARYPDYVPMGRIFSNYEKAGYNGSTGLASVSKQTAVQKIIGSEREVESPLGSLVKKTVNIILQGEKNKAAGMLAGYRTLPGNPFGLVEIESKGIGKNTIEFFSGGVKRIFETTADVSRAAKLLNVQQIGLLGQIMAFPVRAAKLGITGLNLPFVAANIAKDMVTGAINSRHALATSIANPSVFLKSLFETIGHGKVYREMSRLGILGTSFDIARNELPLTIKGIRAGRSVGSKIKYTFTHPSQLLREAENVVSRGEELTRIQQYLGTKQELIKLGMSEENAMIMAGKASAENTVNFMRRGEWGTVINSTFLYMGAGIQGTRTFLRTITQKPLQSIAKIAILAFTPVAVVTAWNLKDPKRRQAYMDIPEWEKKGNIIIIPPNPTKNKDGTWNVWKIPLSQEINNLTGMIRKPIEQAYGLDPVGFMDVADAIIGSVSPVPPETGAALSALTPQAVKPLIEVVANKNLFTGHHIVSEEDRILPEAQTRAYTSGTAKIIGKNIGVSPIKVEHYIRATFGELGSQILHETDVTLAKTGVINKNEIGGRGLFESIVGRFSKSRGGEFVNKAYELKRKATMAHATLMRQIESGASDEDITDFGRRHPEVINYDTLNEITDELGKMFSDRDFIIKQDIPDALKVEAINRIDGNMAKFAESELKLLKEATK